MYFPSFIYFWASRCLVSSFAKIRLRSLKVSLYQPTGIVSTLAALDFIRNGMNLCVFGQADSGKTYMAKALGTEACRDFRVAYCHCDELTGELAAIRKIDSPKYKKKVNSIANHDLVILDDFSTI